MFIVAVTINKGGMGKTTLTKHLAAAATAAGLACVIFDMDTQQNSTSWHKRRVEMHGEQLPLTSFITENDLPDALARVRGAGCDIVFIDTPPGRSSEAPAAVEASNLVLIPFWLESDAHDGAKRTADLARRLGKPAYSVLNFATPNSRSHEDAAREVMADLKIPMSPVILHRYEIYRIANPQGLTVQEIEPDSRAATEVDALWRWLAAELGMSTGANEQEGTSANVHKGAA